MKNVILKIAYDGTAYSGWQKQNSNSIKTIQGVLSDSLEKLTKEPVELIGCSRTDAGVHALNYTANFYTNSPIPPENFHLALRHLLPKDIRVFDSYQGAEDFHSTYSSKGKKYRYFFYISSSSVPTLDDHALFIPDSESINIENMINATKYIEGEHDFTSFCASGGLAKTTVRTIYSCKIFKFYDYMAEKEMYAMEIHGNGFLYNMVRIIMGTLLDVGKGKVNPTDIKDIIASKDRKKAGITVIPAGLHLIESYY